MHVFVLVFLSHRPNQMHWVFVKTAWGGFVFSCFIKTGLHRAFIYIYNSALGGQKKQNWAALGLFVLQKNNELRPFGAQIEAFRSPASPAKPPSAPAPRRPTPQPAQRPRRRCRCSEPGCRRRPGAGGLPAKGILGAFCQGMLGLNNFLQTNGFFVLNHKKLDYVGYVGSVVAPQLGALSHPLFWLGGFPY